MKPFNEDEFRALMLDARMLLWGVADQKDSRRDISSYFAAALDYIVEAACASLQVLQDRDSKTATSKEPDGNNPVAPTA